jgi:phosphoribosylformylglycinamidine (FGAM) synthase PurS component
MTRVDLDFVVARRGLDPAAESCETALRELLGVDLVALERAELWRFRVAAVDTAERAALEERLRSAACRAGRYVNLNRDTCTWLAGPRPWAGPAAGVSAVDVWVCDGDGRDPAALAWFRSQASPRVEDVRHGVLWRLVLPLADPDRARERALEIAETRARRQGLLANPNAQTAEVLHVVRASRTGEGRT